MKLTIVVLAMLISTFGYSQKITADVINSSGSTLTNGDTEMIVNIGEPIIAEPSNGNVTISQGLLQVSLLDPSVSNELVLQETMEVFPNPTQNILTVKFEDPQGEYKFRLVNSQGKVVLSHSSKDSVNQLDVDHLVTGIYHLFIVNEEHQYQTLKVVKTK